jgi:hypothetical protein
VSTEIEAMQANPLASAETVGQVRLQRRGGVYGLETGLTVHVGDVGITGASIVTASYVIGADVPPGVGVDWSDVEALIDSIVEPDTYDAEVAHADFLHDNGRITGQERAALVQAANARRQARNAANGVINSQKAKLPNGPPGLQGAEDVRVRPR